jgi:hypothetical protein
VPENKFNIKLPLYMEHDIHSSIINDTNLYANSIQLKDLLSKDYCCMISRHDIGNTRTPIYKKLSLLNDIICPSGLFNNFSNAEFEKIGRETFQRRFIFSICPENFITCLEGYVTEKLWFACITGTIPIYYGKLDEIDKKIFNINRIILYDPTSEQSINEAYNLVKDLLSNTDKLYEFYKQPVFENTASDILDRLENNMQFRIRTFISNLMIKKLFI